MRAAGLLVVLAFLSGSPAFAACEDKPVAVADYLRGRPEFSILRLQDLYASDITLWRKYRGDACPGLAVVDFDGTKVPSYAVALLSRENGRKFESLLLLRSRGGRISELWLDKKRQYGDKVAPLIVVLRGRSLRDHDHLTGKTVVVPHEPVVYEQLEAHSTVFYSSDGKIRSYIASE